MQKGAIGFGYRMLLLSPRVLDDSGEVSVNKNNHGNERLADQDAFSITSRPKQPF